MKSSQNFHCFICAQYTQTQPDHVTLVDLQNRNKFHLNYHGVGQREVFTHSRQRKDLKAQGLGLAGVPQWTESLVRFPVRAHAWVAGQVPSGATTH